MRAITTFSSFYRNILYVAQAGLNWAGATYDMIVTNPLILSFVIVFALIIGVGILKKLINL